jgi:hypothetical protein
LQSTESRLSSTFAYFFTDTRLRGRSRYVVAKARNLTPETTNMVLSKNPIELKYTTQLLKHF